MLLCKTDQIIDIVTPRQNNGSTGSILAELVWEGPGRLIGFKCCCYQPLAEQ